MPSSAVQARLPRSVAFRQVTSCQGPEGLGGDRYLTNPFASPWSAPALSARPTAGIDRLLMCVCYLGTMGDPWPIPVHDGPPAVQQALDDPSQELAAVAVRLQTPRRTPARRRDFQTTERPRRLP